MISRIYVSPKKGSSRADSYLIDSKLSRHKIEQLAQALTNPILESFCIDKLSNIKDFSYAIEIGFLPGVTDNVGHTVKEIASDLLHLKKSDNFAVYTSKIFFVSGTKEHAQKIALTLYFPNKNIPEINIKAKKMSRYISLITCQGEYNISPLLNNISP